MAYEDRWWINGINKIGGSTIRFTTVEAGPNDSLVITDMGTVGSTYRLASLDANATREKDVLFNTASGTSVYYSTATGSLQTESYYSYPFKQAYLYARSYGHSDWIESITAYVQGFTLTPYYTNSQGASTSTAGSGTAGLHFPKISDDYTAPSISNITDYYKCFTGRSGVGKYALLRTTSDGKGFRFVYIDDPSNARVAIHLIYDGLYTEGSDENMVIDTSYTVLGPALMYIPYSILYNTNYFDPDTDAALPEGDYDDDINEPEGGGGRYGNYPEEDMDFPDLPITSAIDSGFITAYNPTSAQLQSLVNYLWTSDFIDVVKKMINNPMDAVVSLQMIPYDIYDVTSAGSCKIGAVATGITMDKITDQYKVLDCGSINIPLNWGNALDYMNVRMSIYLPFIGIRNVDTDICMDSTLYLKYYVDILTGVCVAMLKCSKSGSSASIYYTWEGNLNYQIPITGANYSEVIKGIMGLSLGAASAVANPAVGLGTIGSNIQNAANVIGQKTKIESSGNLSSNTGMLSGFTPYMIIELPNQSLASNFKGEKGYPCNMTRQLSSLSGYTEVSEVILDGIIANDDEKTEILTLLKSGVVL